MTVDTGAVVRPGDTRPVVGVGGPDLVLAEDDVRAVIGQAISGWDIAGRRILVLIPDRTRTAPVPMLYRLVGRALRDHGALAVTWMVALGTHRPLARPELEELVGVGLDGENRDADGAEVRNHAWRCAEDLVHCGDIDAATMSRLSDGRIRRAVPVRANRAVLDHDVAIVVGPVFPHEVVGFSGGNKYFFPGIASPEMIDASHWLGALITSRSIIGTPGTTPVREMIDLAASMLPIERRSLCAVVRPAIGDSARQPPGAPGSPILSPGAPGSPVPSPGVPGGPVPSPGATGSPVLSAALPGEDDPRLCGLYAGGCEETWAEAARLSAAVHIRRVHAPYERVVSVLPRMYEDIWTAAKGMYKLEPVVADGGQIILYAPHIREFSAVHGALLATIGYHCRDYFVGQWERFAGIPGGVLAHSTHLRGEGTYDPRTGTERCRIDVILATGIDESRCRAMNVGYLDPGTIDFEAEAAKGALVVARAGETLYRSASE